jgi:RNA polymerase primary sigma factor
MKKIALINTDEINQYIKDIRKIPIISHQRQEEIFNTINNGNITKEEKDKFFEELILGNLRFVISVAKMYQNQGMDLLDLISEGNIGLIKAAERFNTKSGLKFISYAVWWVRQSIMASLNDNSRTIRIPSNLVQEAHKNKKRESKNIDGHHIEGEDDQVSSSLPYCVGLYKQINDEGDQLIDLIPNKDAGNPEEIFNTPEEIKKRVARMLNVLDDREKVIIEKYYGLNGIECNLDDLGDEFGCTKERIRQLRDKAIKKLRNESFNLLNYL